MLKQVSFHVKRLEKTAKNKQQLTYSVLDHHESVLRNAQKVSVQKKCIRVGDVELQICKLQVGMFSSLTNTLGSDLDMHTPDNRLLTN